MTDTFGSLVSSCDFAVVEEIFLPHLQWGQVWHDDVGTCQDASLPTIVFRCAQGSGCRKQNSRMQQSDYTCLLYTS